MGGADAEGEGDEEEDADGETEGEAVSEAAEPVKTYHSEWYKRDKCASIRQSFGGVKKQLGTVGNKTDGHSEAKKRKVALDICKLLAAGKITEDKPSLKKKAEELLKNAK